MLNNSTTYSRYICIDAYKTPENPEDYHLCPNCGLTPKVWIFDNGRSTACGCGESQYNHFSVRAESIMSCLKRNNGNLSNYDRDALRKNWNHWVETGEILFNPNYEQEGIW